VATSGYKYITISMEGCRLLHSVTIHTDGDKW